MGYISIWHYSSTFRWRELLLDLQWEACIPANFRFNYLLVDIFSLEVYALLYWVMCSLVYAYLECR